jgi:hypothetical protein
MKQAIINRLSQLEARGGGQIPLTALIVLPTPYESNEAALSRTLEGQPEMVLAPRIFLRLPELIYDFEL